MCNFHEECAGFKLVVVRDLKLKFFIPYVFPSNWSLICNLYYPLYKAIKNSSSQHTKLCYCLLRNQVVLLSVNALFYTS